MAVAPETRTAPAQAPPTVSTGFPRILSAVEFAVGAFFVFAYNVFHILPNEVPILCGLGLLSFRLRNGGWAAMGLVRPASWTRILLIGAAAAAARLVIGEAVGALTAGWWPSIATPEDFSAVRGNALVAGQWLLTVWSFAAFGEEVGYRGYLLGRAADVGGRSPGACWTGLVLAAILFGIGHTYKGPAGMIDSGVAGLVYGAAYMLSGRNLWAAILAHGFVDTAGVCLLYFGLAS
jgi:membrane protease YdiL (CAAX protease family)